MNKINLNAQNLLGFRLQAGDKNTTQAGAKSGATVGAKGGGGGGGGGLGDLFWWLK